MHEFQSMRDAKLCSFYPEPKKLKNFLWVNYLSKHERINSKRNSSARFGTVFFLRETLTLSRWVSKMCHDDENQRREIWGSTIFSPKWSKDSPLNYQFRKRKNTIIFPGFKYGEIFHGEASRNFPPPKKNHEQISIFPGAKNKGKTPWWAFDTSPCWTFDNNVLRTTATRRRRRSRNRIWSHWLFIRQPSQKTNLIPLNRNSSGFVFTWTVFEFMAMVIHETGPTSRVFDFWMDFFQADLLLLACWILCPPPESHRSSHKFPSVVLSSQCPHEVSDEDC